MKSPIVLTRAALVIASTPDFAEALVTRVRCCNFSLKIARRRAWTQQAARCRTGKDSLPFQAYSQSVASTSTMMESTSSSACTVKDAAERIYRITGKKFDIGKPSILSKVLFDEMKVADPNSEPLLIADGTEKAARRRAKLRSVSMTSISAMLEAEADPVKRELLQLVRDWLSARTQEKRGGFLGSGAKVADMPGWTSNIIPDDDDLPEDASALPVVLIDGHYIIFRSFYAMPSLTAPDGTPVGALVGFCNVINKLAGMEVTVAFGVGSHGMVKHIVCLNPVLGQVLQPWADGSEPHRRVVVALDTGKDTFRHKIDPGYKADRAEVPEDLRPQFPLIRQACEAYGLDVFEREGFEADDVIASLALQAVNAGATNVTIVSADKDLAQLVTRRVKMLNYYTDELLGPEEVLAKFLAPPGRLADLLAIAGDKADGIKGAEGYGPVTAAKVLAQHSSLEEAVSEICSTMSKKKKDPALIADSREQVLLARRMVELCTTVPLDNWKGSESIHEQARYDLTSREDGARRLLAFMRDAGMPDLVRRTAAILGVDKDGNKPETK